MKKLLVILCLALLLPGCVQTLAIRTVGGIMDYGLEAFNEEGDLQLAQEALGANLKLIEALLKGDPDNEKLLLLATQGYSAYALAFAEDVDPVRAHAFYARARDYGLRILNQKPEFRSALGSNLDAFRASLAVFSQDEVPQVFWTAFAWGAYVNTGRADIAAVADLPRVNALMDFVLRHDSTYYYGGAHLYFGTIEGSTPTMLGGKPAKAREHFETCLRINEGKFLMTHVYYASTYAVQVQDRELFESLLKTVLDAPADILPEVRLPNAVAKWKAERWLSQIDELF